MKMYLKMSSAKWRQFCPGVHELRIYRMMMHMKCDAEGFINAISLSQSGGTIDGSNSFYDEEHNTNLLILCRYIFNIIKVHGCHSGLASLLWGIFAFVYAPIMTKLLKFSPLNSHGCWIKFDPYTTEYMAHGVLATEHSKSLHWAR